jgi:hypothetical protein
VANGQHRQLVPPKPAGEQKGKKCPITFTLHLYAVGRLRASPARRSTNCLPLLPVSLRHSLAVSRQPNLR